MGDDSDTDMGTDADTELDSDTDVGSDTDSDVDTDTDSDSEEPVRTSVTLEYCPSSPTAPGYYEGSTASNLNDIASSTCIGSAPGRDGAVRVELTPGDTVTATYTLAGGAPSRSRQSGA